MPDPSRSAGRAGVSKALDQAVSALIEEQGGLCAICREAKPLQRDHDHTTGFIRGLLCRECNIILGIAKDSPDLLRRAVAYLEREPTQIPYGRTTPLPAGDPTGVDPKTWRELGEEIERSLAWLKRFNDARLWRDAWATFQSGGQDAFLRHGWLPEDLQRLKEMLDDTALVNSEIIGSPE